MKIYEIFVDAYAPTEKQIYVPADSDIGFSLNIKGKVNIVPTGVFDENGDIYEPEGYLDTFETIPYYKWHSLPENECEKFHVEYTVPSDPSGREQVPAEVYVNVNCVKSGFSYVAKGGTELPIVVDPTDGALVYTDLEGKVYEIDTMKVNTDMYDFELNAQGDGYEVSQASPAFPLNGVNQIPETYNGKPVVGVAEKGFHEGQFAKVKLPETINYIKNSAFKRSTLRNIVIPNSVSSLGLSCCCLCRSLESVSLPNNKDFKIISTGAFVNTPILSIEIPESVETIQEFGLDGCEYLRNVILPSKLKTIGDYAFRSDLSLKTLSIPSSVTSIGRGAFQDYSSSANLKIIMMEGKTMAQVKAMANYPWDIKRGSKFICTDGTIVIS